MRIKLSQEWVDSAEYQGSGPSGTCYVWDSELPRFGIRIYPSGNKSFVVNYRNRGRRRFLTLAPTTRMSLPQARSYAEMLFFRITYLGEDPAEERKVRRSPTMRDLSERYLKEHVAIRHKPRSLKRARQAWARCVLPRLGDHPISEVRRSDILSLMTDMAETPSMANRVLGLLSSAFNLAELWEWRQEGTNPCRLVKRYKEEPRQRYLSESELNRLGVVLRRHEQDGSLRPQALAAIRLLIFTGCRSGEILTLSWAEVDFARKTLELKDSKTGRRSVILNSAALSVLEALRSKREGAYVIPGRTPDRHLSTLQTTWARLRVDAEIEDVRIHDLRHTHASFGVNNGQSLEVVGKLLGHTKILTTQRYAHLADDLLRQASEQIGSGLAASLG